MSDKFGSLEGYDDILEDPDNEEEQEKEERTAYQAPPIEPPIQVNILVSYALIAMNLLVHYLLYSMNFPLGNDIFIADIALIGFIFDHPTFEDTKVSALLALFSAGFTVACCSAFWRFCIRKSFFNDMSEHLHTNMEKIMVVVLFTAYGMTMFLEIYFLIQRVALEADSTGSVFGIVAAHGTLALIAISVVLVFANAVIGILSAYSSLDQED
ncbi:MAG: hypothetical protein ACQ9MH_15355 [Nitrospinales bacterium]